MRTSRSGLILLWAGLTALVLTPLMNAAAQSTGAIDLRTDKPEYLPGEPVKITLANVGTMAITGTPSIAIYDANNGSAVFDFCFTQVVQTLAPGEEIVVTWDQIDQDGRAVPEGDYVVTGSFGGLRDTALFTIGQGMMPAGYLVIEEPVGGEVYLVGDPVEILWSFDSGVDCYVLWTFDIYASGPSLAWVHLGLVTYDEAANKPLAPFIWETGNLSAGEYQVMVAGEWSRNDTIGDRYTAISGPFSLLSEAVLGVYTDHDLYPSGEPVHILLINEGAVTLSGTPEVSILDAEGVLIYAFPMPLLIQELLPGASMEFVWDQSRLDGSPAGIGSYVVVASFGGASGRASFDIVPGGSLHVIAPNGGEVYRVGEVVPIEWEFAAPPTPVDGAGWTFELYYARPGWRWVLIDTLTYNPSANPDTQTYPSPYAWDTTGVEPGSYEVWVVGVYANLSMEDASDGAFEIVEDPAPASITAFSHHPEPASPDEPVAFLVEVERGPDLLTVVIELSLVIDFGDGTVEAATLLLPSGGSTATKEFVHVYEGSPIDVSKYLATATLVDASGTLIDTAEDAVTVLSEPYEAVLVVTDQEVYLPGEPVEISIENVGDAPLSGTPFCSIFDASGDVVAEMAFAQVVYELAPGEVLTVTWDQRDGSGEPVPEGNYTALAGIGDASDACDFGIEGPPALWFDLVGLYMDRSVVYVGELVFVEAELQAGPHGVPVVVEVTLTVTAASGIVLFTSTATAVIEPSEGAIVLSMEPFKATVSGRCEAVVEAVGPDGAVRSSSLTFEALPRLTHNLWFVDVPPVVPVGEGFVPVLRLVRGENAQASVWEGTARLRILADAGGEEVYADSNPFLIPSGGSEAAIRFAPARLAAAGMYRVIVDLDSAMEASGEPAWILAFDEGAPVVPEWNDVEPLLDDPTFDGTYGGMIDVGLPDDPAIYLGGLSLRVLRVEDDLVEIGVIGHGIVGGTVVDIRINRTMMNLTDAGDLLVALDGVPVRFGSLRDVLGSSGTEDADALYCVALDDTGFHVLIYIPHFSEHRVVLQRSRSEAAPGGPTPLEPRDPALASLFGGRRVVWLIVGAVAVLALGAALGVVVLVRNRREPEPLVVEPVRNEMPAWEELFNE